mmetsp:Transcript_62006/g.147910  ORF Transcript_62006/g.147910 Transcript_62006/m.147910 type:complete len:100 (+) Transcript_62006:227-526(+)
MDLCLRFSQPTELAEASTELDDWKAVAMAARRMGFSTTVPHIIQNCSNPADPESSSLALSTSSCHLLSDKQSGHCQSEFRVKLPQEPVNSSSSTSYRAM